jgi:quercetin dioxygenase-like cupin family protein
MATRGQTIINPASGERITFRTTAAETDGELVAIDLQLAPGGRVPGGKHFHPLQEERFEVVRGTMRFRVRRQTVFVGPGEALVIGPGVPHDFANVGDEEALVRVEVRPALKMEQLFEAAVALAEAGRTMCNGIPRPLDLALFTRQFEPEVQAAFPPRWLQRLVFAPLAWLAKRRDDGARYDAEPAPSFVTATSETGCPDSPTRVDLGSAAGHARPHTHDRGGARASRESIAGEPGRQTRRRGNRRSRAGFPARKPLPRRGGVQ